MSAKKQPISVLVVIYTTPSPFSASGGSGQADPDVLLLERADHPGYWQSVTGSREGDEALLETAMREVSEETGLDASQYVLTDWQLQNTYEIYPHWRHRYADGVTQNTEHVFGLELPERLAVQVAPREHLRYVWLPWQDAAQQVFSPSNKDAILRLAKIRKET